MRKIILDMNVPQSKEEVQDYLMEKMGFPEYYGKNLDALYDELTSVTSPTAIGFFMPCPEMADMDIDLMVYIDRVRGVFGDAEEANPDLAVIVGEMPAGGWEDWDPEEDGWDTEEEWDPEGELYGDFE